MHLGGVTANPTGESTVQQARNLALTVGERFENFRFLIRDRGSNFTRSFDAVFQANGTRILQTVVQAPRMNATCERLLGTLRRELLDRMLILSEASARRPDRVPGPLQHGPAASGHRPAGSLLGVRSSRRHSSQPRCPANPPETRTERADQRIQPSRLTPRRNRRPGAGSYFRAGQDLPWVDVGHARGVSVTFVTGDTLGDALVRPCHVVVRLVPGQDGTREAHRMTFSKSIGWRASRAHRDGPGASRCGLSLFSMPVAVASGRDATSVRRHRQGRHRPAGRCCRRSGPQRWGRWRSASS